MLSLECLDISRARSGAPRVLGLRFCEMFSKAALHVGNMSPCWYCLLLHISRELCGGVQSRIGAA